ncbi:small multi-drug export protein [Desertibacillus haloalkaliphilus]|uniref:small multi-drug export protein n=1 Tax=Desertibacillus haloalkaliphilus TaxID=1328930 RepID=UPI001C27E9B1|nr:small multi-drug export protein [Desertibacillus haloalkaliphilus]MBU8906802.1 small multi-drug export protein [Desertibacillus haloalkaliphilus]
MIDLLWQYTLIFIMAATPWLEILLVIPIGIGMGLHPFWVGVVSFVGNFLPVLFIVYSLKKIQHSNMYRRWKQKREEKKQQKEAAKQLDRDETMDSNDERAHAETTEYESNHPNEVEKKLSKQQRAFLIFQKYGLPGLAILGPFITGIHLAAIIALTLKADKHKTTIWMGISLLLWTVFLTIASYYSIDWVSTWFS